MKTKSLLSILVGAVATFTILGNVGSKKTACEIYQGYTFRDGSTLYVFDNLPSEQRARPPKYSLEGNFNLKDSVLSGNEIEKRFCFTYYDPISFMGQNTIKEVYPDSTNIRNK